MRTGRGLEVEHELSPKVRQTRSPWTAFMNQGQICMSTERIIVETAVADAVVAKLAAKATRLPAGDPRGPVVLGSVTDLASAEKMDALVADALAKGAGLVCGGKRTGAAVEATLFDHVTPAMRVYAEESFGPVKPIVRVTGADEAVRVADDTEYGLSSGCGRFGANAVIEAFTEPRWITIEGRQHYPF